MEQDEKIIRDLSFDDYLKNKEKRRKSRSKGKRVYVKGKIRNHQDKPRTRKVASYNYDGQEDDFDE